MTRRFHKLWGLGLAGVLVASNASALTIQDLSADAFEPLPIGNAISAFNIDSPADGYTNPNNVNTTVGSRFVEYYNAAVAQHGPNLLSDRFIPDADLDGIHDGGTFDRLQVQNQRLTFTYLGTEADYGNSFLTVGTNDFGTIGAEQLIFSNYTDTQPTPFFSETSVGATTAPITFHALQDLTLAFCTDRNRNGVYDGPGSREGCIDSRGVSYGDALHLEVAVSRIFAFEGQQTALLFFGDGYDGDDADLEDMVIAVSGSIVPLPASFWLMASLIVGLGLSGRRRHQH